VLAALAAWNAALPAAWAAHPYQPYRDIDFGNRVQVDHHPAVWFHRDASHIAYLVDIAQKHLKDCRLSRFRDVIAELKKDQAWQARQYDKWSKEVAKAKAALPAQEAEASTLRRRAMRLIPPATSSEMELAAKAEMRVEDLQRTIEEGSKHAELLLQDSNSLASIIVWLEKTKVDCRGRPEAPPPPPAPPPRLTEPEEILDPNCPAEMIDEINRARTNPTGYADRWRGGGREAIDFLRNQPAVPELDPNNPLMEAAGRHAADPGANGHTGTDGSRPMQRIRQAGLFSTMTAELMAPQRDPQAAVRALIEDHSSPTRAHRNDLFNPNFTLIGVGCPPGDRPGGFIVIDLSNPPLKRDD
jgi:hypothetical protein